MIPFGTNPVDSAASRAKRGSFVELFDHERLPRDEHPAGDAGARGEALTDEVFGAFAGDGLEDELVGGLVEEEDRGGAGAEDRPGDLDD